MKAFVLHGAKDIRQEEVARPVPGPGEVLVAVRAAGICGSDLHYYAHGRCGNFIPTRPFILGHEFAGEVVAHGEGVESPADRHARGRRSVARLRPLQAMPPGPLQPVPENGLFRLRQRRSAEQRLLCRIRHRARRATAGRCRTALNTHGARC